MTETAINPLISAPSWLDFYARQLVMPQLADGETLLWLGRPNWRYGLVRQFLLWSIFPAIFLGFYISPWPPGPRPLSSLIFLFLWSWGSVVYRFYDRKDAIFALSDRRAFSVFPSHEFPLASASGIASDVKQLRGRRVALSNSALKTPRGKPLRLIFFSLDDADRLVRLANDAIAARARTEP